MEFTGLKKQYKILKPTLLGKIEKTLDSGQFIMGKDVPLLEEKLQKLYKYEHCISCANGTDALVLSLMAMNIKKGDIVFTSAFSFIATAEAIALVGATPVFVDVEPDTFNIDIKSLKEKIKTTKGFKAAIIPVNIFGLPANYKELSNIALENNLNIIADAAQGLGSKNYSNMVDTTTLSFFPSKPLGGYGDGGAILTNSTLLSIVLKSLRSHGKGVSKYDNIKIGMNSRLDTIQATILLEKLKLFKEENIKRNIIAERYTRDLKSKYKVQNCKPFESNYAQYSLLSESREKVITELKANNIPVQIYYNKPIHKQTAFESYSKNKLPVAERISKQIFSIPISPYLTKKEQEKVINVLLNVTR